MTRLTVLVMTLILLHGPGIWAQEGESGSTPDSVADAIATNTHDITGSWITQAANLVELSVDGIDVRLHFPAFARTMMATYTDPVLVYVTHYNDPEQEQCYFNAPESVYETCRRFVKTGDPRHRFTLRLSEDGSVLSGIKEINVLKIEWDTDEEGNPINLRPMEYEWEYFCDYQWRRANCDFSTLPSLGGNVIERFELVDTLLDRFGLRAEYSLGEFEARERIRFVYDQAYLDADTGVFVPLTEVS